MREDLTTINKSTTNKISLKSLLSQSANTNDLKKLRLQTRNKIRAIFTAKIAKAIKIYTELRKRSSAKELVLVDSILRLDTTPNDGFIPELFPSDFQCGENYHRVDTISYLKQAEIIELLLEKYSEKLDKFLNLLGALNFNIVQSNYKDADTDIEGIYQISGYSHFLLRKACYLRELAPSNIALESSDRIIDEAHDNGRIIPSSLVQCYQEQQDFLSMKKSIMNIADRGKSNKFTRDISRLTFHPFARDKHDFNELIQSNLQSSLIDAIIILKVNNRHFNLSSEKYPRLVNLFGRLQAQSPSLDQIIYPYFSLNYENIEWMFYKHSSAWLENDELIAYREVQDHLFDDPNSAYFTLTETIISNAKSWFEDVSLEKLADDSPLTKSPSSNLQKITTSGYITRSSAFNFILHTTEGMTTVSESSLFKIMGKTRDLARTVNVEYLTKLSVNSNSKLAQIVCYLLIARKTRNEADNHQLRRLIQNITIEKFDGNLVMFVKGLSEKSFEVAEYAYDVCTEDFIAKLYHIISSATEITETRAELHQWMGEVSNNKNYIDRARNLLIDHQINKTRNELDDNRIFVDVARFSEWLNDEVVRDLNVVLSSIDRTAESSDIVDPQLMQIIQKSYERFCSDNIFGMASYLGRRIRHGTFKGHLYSSVVSSLESEYGAFLRDPVIEPIWDHWKTLYATIIYEIIRERLHVNSLSKPKGLLNPTINASKPKTEIVVRCAQNLLKDFNEHRNNQNSVQLLTEYCWRLAEVDLRNINSYLKGQKATLIQNELLSNIKNHNHDIDGDYAKDFIRDLNHLINDKLLAMYSWFKKPVSISPKASLSLLYKAVVAEVKDTFENFDADTNFEDSDDIELVGGAYHVLYDAFYVVVYNAAKHGKPNGNVLRNFRVEYDERQNSKVVRITISSEIRDNDSEQEINSRLSISPTDDIENAQLSEDRSGIRKLHHLERTDNYFSVERITCENRKVIVVLTYALEISI